MRVHRLENRETRWKFQLELSRRFKEATEKSGKTLMQVIICASAGYCNIGDCRVYTTF